MFKIEKVFLSKWKEVLSTNLNIAKQCADQVILNTNKIVLVYIDNRCYRSYIITETEITHLVIKSAYCDICYDTCDCDKETCINYCSKLIKAKLN